MKRILYILLVSLICYNASGQFANTQSIGSKSTFYKSLGGISADSGLIILNSFPDTATANFSVVSKYNSFIRVGTNLYFRTLVPPKWNLLVQGSGSGFITPSDTASMLLPYLRKSDTAAMLSNRLKISDTATMLQRGWLSNRSKDSIAVIRALANSKGNGTVVSIATNIGSGIAGGTITTSGTLRIDTLNVSTRLWRQKGIDSVTGLVTALDLAKLNISDTSSMLGNYLRKTDTANLVSPYTRVTRFTDSLTNIQARIQTKQPLGNYLTFADSSTILAGRWLPNRSNDTATALQSRIQTKQPLLGFTPLNIADSLLGGYTTWALTKKKVDSLGALIGGGGTVTSIATNNGSGITGGTITTSGTIAADTTILSTKANVTASLLGKVNISDTATMLNPYIVAQSLTTDYIPKALTGRKFVNSQIFDNGTNVVVGGTSGSSLFNVIGQSNLTNTTTYSSGTSTALGVSANTTYSGTLTSSGVSFSSIVNNHVATFNGNTTVDGATPFASSLPSSFIGFSNTGTVTMNNSSGGGIKSLSALMAGSFDYGSVNGTVTKTSGIQINGIFKVAGSTATITRTDHYQLLIGDINEFSGGGNVTNKWAIYQVGTNDISRFFGAVQNAGGTTQFTSDARIKENIVPFTRGLSEIDQIETHKFNYIYNKGNQVTGIIAQELEKIIPEAISKGTFELPDGSEKFSDFRMVDQNVLFYSMLNAIKELSAKIKILESKVK